VPQGRNVNLQTTAAPPTIIFVRAQGLSGVLLIAACLVGSGCQSQLSRVRADNARLSSEVATLRAKQRREDRDKRVLAGRMALRRDTRASGDDADATADLPVAVLGPADVSAPVADTLGGGFSPRTYADGTRVVGVTEDGTEIIYADDAMGVSGSAGDDDDATFLPDDDLGAEFDEPAPAPPPRPAPPPPPKARVKASPASIEARYRAAVDMLKADEHAAAIAALRAFVADFPGSDLADNAQYWLGEAFYDQHDYAQALIEFRATVSSYPDGNKRPDAMLKIGFALLATGETELARAQLTALIDDFPTSEPATLAAARLETLTP
jgi:tol-pal system protein YbgF